MFNRKLDFNDIVKIKLDMSQKGIVLDYKKLQFDEYGKLILINFSVDCKDGFSGSASNDQLRNQSRFGFYRFTDTILKMRSHFLGLVVSIEQLK